MTKNKIEAYKTYSNEEPIYLIGDALFELRKLPDNFVDCIITSPPYWGQRQYENGGIGLEETYLEFIENLLEIIKELKRVLKPTGSFWLNIGDKYHNKSLLGIPWQVALRMINEQNWTLRNSIIWNKQKGGMNSTKDRLSNAHEHVFHFVKKAKGYYYDDNAIRSKPRKSKVQNGAVVSATGVSGKRYKRQIELSTSLTEIEKKNAFWELENVLKRIENNELADFRMIIRNQQRSTHSDSEKLSGRAKQLKDKGFYFLFYNPNGTMPNDVWDIIPEDTQKRKKHYAVFPEDLCKIPILATCPQSGIVLDPFCGTGTTMRVAKMFNRKSIGIDISAEYIKIAKGINLETV